MKETLSTTFIFISTIMIPWDLVRLDMALSEFRLRDDFSKGIGSFYKHNMITCLDELEWLLNREADLQTVDMDFILPSE